MFLPGLIVCCICISLPEHVNTFAPSLSWSSATRNTPLFSSTATDAAAEDDASPSSLRSLRVAIVGAGPSGLLLAHKLLAAGCGHVTVLEGRRRYTTSSSRAYALGLSFRGRTAICSVDQELYDAVEKVGFASERFRVYLPGSRWSFKLRDGKGNKNKNQETTDGERPAKTGVGSASLIMFQADLCNTMAAELERRYPDRDRLELNFDSMVEQVDLDNKFLLATSTKGDWQTTHKFDVVVGCDGVNSVVRQALDRAWPDFETTKSTLPGYYKVVTFAPMPPKLDGEAVALLVPKSGPCGAFVEPVSGNRCCVLFSGPDSARTDPLLASRNVTELIELMQQRFPLLAGADLDDAARQLASTDKLFQASAVTCNTYHYRDAAVLVGDACHATGGVSGQGVNSALVDSTVLSNCLERMYTETSKEESLREALLTYSQLQVPEGKALYDISFPPKPTSAWKRLGQATRSARDALFKGGWGIGNVPLRTMLSQTLTSFADIRKTRDRDYNESFPEQARWNETLAELDARAKASVAA